jgi:hypothetical protein
LDALPPEDRNCVLFCFTDPEGRSSIVLPDETARLMAAKFRTAIAGRMSLADPDLEAQARALSG